MMTAGTVDSQYDFIWIATAESMVCGGCLLKRYHDGAERRRLACRRKATTRDLAVR
jgi:hypothetical protein